MLKGRKLSSTYRLQADQQKSGWNKMDLGAAGSRGKGMMRWGRSQSRSFVVIHSPIGTPPLSC